MLIGTVYDWIWSWRILEWIYRILKGSNTQNSWNKRDCKNATSCVSEGEKCYDKKSEVSRPKQNRWCVGSLQIKGFKYGRMSFLLNEVILNPNPANRRVCSLDSCSVFNSRFLTVFIEFIIKPHHKIAEILMTNRQGVFMVWRVFQLKFRRPFPGSIRSVRERSSASWTIGSSKRSSWKGRCNYWPRHREWEFKKNTPVIFYMQFSTWKMTILKQLEQIFVWTSFPPPEPAFFSWAHFLTRAKKEKTASNESISNTEIMGYWYSPYGWFIQNSDHWVYYPRVKFWYPFGNVHQILSSTGPHSCQAGGSTGGMLRIQVSYEYQLGSPSQLTWQQKMDLLKMYLLLKNGGFQLPC